MSKSNVSDLSSQWFAEYSRLTYWIANKCVRKLFWLKGRDALRKVRDDGPARTLVGFDVDSKRIPRQGATIFHGDEAVGKVTSGTKSLTLGKMICMAYIPRVLDCDADGWEVEISKRRYPLARTELPFYSRTRK